jgi:hypothetical protein
MVCSEVTKHLAFCFVPTGCVLSANLDVFPDATEATFALLQSGIHDAWARFYSSHLETRLKYSPGNAYETFPFPLAVTGLDGIGARYHAYRNKIMREDQQGLTSIYNRVHDTNDNSETIGVLRKLQIEMDNTVAAGYGWTNLDLGHGFRQTRHGVRFTISESASQQVLDRLLRLNHERYAEESAQGLYDKKANKKTKSRVGNKPSDEPRFEFEEQEA